MSTFIHEQMKFFFIHVPKTGGTTATRFFKTSKDHDWRNIYSSLNHALPIHAGVEEVRARLGTEMDSYFSFAFYRNTWDWAYSLYRYIAKTTHHPDHLTAKGVDFEDWVMALTPEKVRLQSKLVCENGVQKVSRLIPFTQFGTEYPVILAELGYQDVTYKSYNMDPNKKPYRDVYSDKSRGWIADLYQEDITYFDFSF